MAPQVIDHIFYESDVEAEAVIGAGFFFIYLLFLLLLSVFDICPRSLGADDLRKQFQRRRCRRTPGGAALWPAEVSVAPLMSWREPLLCPSSLLHSAHSLHPSRALETDDLTVESIFNISDFSK